MASEGASRVMTVSSSPAPTRAFSFTLNELVSDPPMHVAEMLSQQPDGVIERLKEDLQRLLLGGSEKCSEFTTLQKLVAKQLPELTADTLVCINRSQLEILVAIRTGIQGFLHPDITITQGVLAQIFLQKRCRNIACQAPLPANDCACKACSSDSGFCNMCMCISCFTFDFEANTCRWVGCDFCLHWCHSDCALHLGDVGITTSRSSIQAAAAGEDLQYLCPACGHASELFGFVSDVFQNCAGAWKRDNLARELACVERMFQHSTDPRGQRLSTWAQKLQMHLEGGASYVQVCRVMQRFFAGSKGVDGQQCSPLVSAGAPSQSEAASSPLGRRNCGPNQPNFAILGELFPNFDQHATGSDTGNWTHAGGWRNRQPHSILFSMDGIVNTRSAGEWRGIECARYDVAAGTEAHGGKGGGVPAAIAGNTEMRQTWRQATLGMGREKEVGASIEVFGSSREDGPVAAKPGNGFGRQDVMVVVVGMGDQARALKRSRRIIDGYRENLAELQGVVAELHKEIKLEESAIEELEQRVARKQAEQKNYQKKADEALREVEAMRGSVRERRAAISARFEEQIARLNCEEAEIRCSTVHSAVQILVGSRQRLDEAQDTVIECLQGLVHGVPGMSGE